MIEVLLIIFFTIAYICQLAFVSAELNCKEIKTKKELLLAINPFRLFIWIYKVYKNLK